MLAVQLKSINIEYMEGDEGINFPKDDSDTNYYY